MRAIIILAFIACAYLASAKYVCQDTSNKSTAPACNTTALQSKLPAKACAMEPASATMTDFTFFCTEAGFRAWRDSCPKLNTNLEGFCSGTGSAETFCNMFACENDGDCPSTEPVPVSDEKPCYDCCTRCQEDSVCDGLSGDGKTFAAKGSTDCISCAVVAPVSSSAIVTPILSLMGVAALL
jgi:hypothetical protein